MVHPQEQLPIEEIPSPFGAQILEFYDPEFMFQETMQNSDVASSSNNGCYEEQQSSYPTNLGDHQKNHNDMNKYNNNTSIDSNNEINPPHATSTAPSTPTVTTTVTNNNLPEILDDPNVDHIDNNDISTSIDFTTSPSFSNPNHHHHHHHHHNHYLNNNNNNQEPFNISSLSSQLSLGDPMNGSSLHQPHHQYAPERWSTVAAPPPSAVVPMLGPQVIPTGYEDECMPSVAPYIRLRPSPSSGCTLIDPMMAPFLPPPGMGPPFSGEGSGIFAGNSLMLGTDLSHQELDFQGDNGGLFLPDTMQRVFNCSSELQALSSESQHLVHGGSSTSTPLASEISSLEDPTFKVGKLSVEERKRKIHRYMKKRNERNFSKKIKYACRKTLADSRPRVRGRFAKNDELGELARTNGCGNHEDDDDDDVTLFSNSIPDHQRKAVVKEEDDMDSSSDIFAHISGVNSFKCNYPIQSWI